MTSDSTVRISFGPCKLKFQEFICIRRNSTTTISIPSRLLQLLLQLRMCGGSSQCCLSGCINDAGSYPLTACWGSHEANPNTCVLNITVGIETGQITYIPCCSCQVNIKCVQPYGCSHHMSNFKFLNSTFHVTCNNGDNVTSTSDVQSTTRNKNFICLSRSQGLKHFRAHVIVLTWPIYTLY